MAKENEGSRRGEPIDALVQQYLLAADLYKHEDALNWQKLNNLFYVTAGLMMIVGFNVEAATQNPDFVTPVRNVLIFVTALGFIISVAFAFALRSGVKYLQFRKESVAAIEHELVDCGCKYVVSSKDWREEPKSQKRMSHTARILTWTPVLLCIFWVIALTLVLIR